MAEEKIKRKIIIADGNNLGWMAFGIAPLTYKEQRVEAIYVGLNMIRGYLQRFGPTQFCVAWDSGRDERRLAVYPNYKKRRKVELTEVEKRERGLFFNQLRELQRVLESFGIRQYKVKGKEADDVIISLINELSMGDSSSEHFIIVSTDKDFYQAFSLYDNVSVYNPVKREIIEASDVEKRFNIPIKYFLEYRAMVGDPSDRLPGVRGIGPKWAAWAINNIFAPSLESFVKKEFTQSQENVIAKLDSEDFELMCSLVEFKEILKKELREGKFEDRPETCAELQERGIEICERYGFERHANNFTNFILPFEMLWRKGER